VLILGLIPKLGALLFALLIQLAAKGVDKEPFTTGGSGEDQTEQS